MVCFSDNYWSINGKWQWSTRIHNLARSAEKNLLSFDWFFVVITYLIWNHLRHFEDPIQKVLLEALQHFQAEQNLLISLRDIFQSQRLMVQALHTTRVTMLIFRGETAQPKARMGTNKGKPGLGVSKAIKKSADLI